MKPIVVWIPFALHAITAAALPLNSAVGSPRDGVVASPRNERRNINCMSVKRITTDQLSEVLAELLSVQGQVALLLPTVTSVQPANDGLLGGLLGGLTGLLPPVSAVVDNVASLLLPGLLNEQISQLALLSDLAAVVSSAAALVSSILSPFVSPLPSLVLLISP